MSGCPCEPSGSDGLTCPDANGRLLCDDSHVARALRCAAYGIHFHADPEQIKVLGAELKALAPDNVRQVLCEALAWGATYGSVIPGHQWDAMRDEMVDQFAARLAVKS